MPGLEQLNGLEEADAAELFRACCASTRWVSAMVAARPFVGEPELLSAAERIWWSLQPEDWFEALAAHPRIGETAARARVSEISRGWSIGEQETVAASDAEARQRLAASIQAYEQRFGWLYLVSATGRSAADLLDDIQARLANDPAREQVIVAREQLEIMRLRIRKMLA